jgi:hypothetical protein
LREEANKLRETLHEEAEKIAAIPVPQMPFDLKVLIDAVQKSKSLSPFPDTVLTDLNELNEDLRFFDANTDNKLRREIDLQKLYPFPRQFLMAN